MASEPSAKRDLLAELQESVKQAKKMRLAPIRDLRPNPIPKPRTDFTRACQTCGASFLELAAGKAGERGIWSEWRWYCSQQCFDDGAVK